MNGICVSETRIERRVGQSLRWIVGVAVAALLGFVGHGAEPVVCDGTNRWIGAASGGSWKDPSNWRALSAKGYSVEELFRRYAVYDLRGLAGGAVLTNDYAGGNAYNLRDSTGQTFVCGLVASGEPGAVWTVVPGADAGAVRFCAPSTVDVAGGLIDFRTPLAGSCTYPVMTPAKTGSGAFRFGVPATYLWESVWTTAAGTTVLSTNFNLIAFKFAQANGGRLLVTPPGMSRVCCITAVSGTKADASAVVEIAHGATLDLSSGFNTFSGTWYGDVAGAGDLRLSGGGNYVFAKGQKTAPLSLTGTYRLTNADLAFGTAATPNPPSPAAALAADASGLVRLFTDQALRAISGAGAGGGVVWPTNRTLTVAGAGETNVFAARLVGGAFTYAAPNGRLTLTGANGYSGPTTVAAGTLAVRRPKRTAAQLLPAPLARWTFDEAVVSAAGDVVFPDSGPHGWNLVSVPTNANGRLLHVVTGAMTDNDGHVTRFAATSNANTAVRLQSGVKMSDALADGSSFTVSLRSGRSSSGVFLIFGDGTAAGSVRLSHEGCPRYPAWFAGSSTRRGDNDALITYTMSPANWTQLTLVYDAPSKTLTRYLDGVCQSSVTATVNLKPRDLVLAAKTLDPATGALDGQRQNLHFDDLRVYGMALDAEQVAALVREVRGVEGAGAPEPIPAGSPVTVAAGATLAVEAGGEVALGRLAGAGVVEVADGATFSCADLANFTGRIVCRGEVNLTDAQWAARERGDFTLEYVPTDYLRNVSPDVVTCTSLPDDVKFYSTLYTKSWNSYGAKDAYRIDAEGRRPFGYCSGSVTQAVGCVDVVARRDGTAQATWTMRPVRELPDLNQFCVSLGLTVRAFAGGAGRVVVDGETKALTDAVAPNKTFKNPKEVVVYDRDGRMRIVLEPLQDCTLLVQDNRSGGWSETVSLRFSVSAPDGWTVGADYVQAFRLSHPEAHLEVKPFGYKTLAADGSWVPLAATYADTAAGGILDFSSLRRTPGDAGACGRVVVRNGRFEFEDLPGVPQRFFGANLTEDAACPDKAAVGRCCAQLARMGYNAVRIHHHEKRLVAGGGDLAATNLSATAMEKFDALVAACITNGLYLTTDLFVSRSPVAWRAVGYGRDGSLATDDFKYLVYADERVFANLCDFTRNFFSHVNPHTGRSLAAEPALLGINLINEGNKSYFGNPRNLLANYPVWQPKWEAWLAAKKGTEPHVYGALSPEPPANLTATAEGAAFAQFLRETEESLFDRLKAFLRDELGCRAPLTNLNGGSDKTAAYFLPRAERYDYIDYHRYIDHPSFLETSWQLPARTGNSNPLTDVRAGMPALLDLRIPGKPFMLSEWNYSGPSLHRSMGGLYYGAIHALQDHDGLFRFAWSQGKGGVENPEGKSAGGFFDIVGDPLARASERIAALLFMRGDLKPLRKSYVYRYTRKVASGALADQPGGSGTAEERHWAGWFAKLGSVVGDVVPTGAVEAGVWPNAAKTRAQVWADLGVVPPADGSLPPGGDGQVKVDGTVGSIAVSTSKTAAFFVPRGEGTAGPLVARVGEESATVCAAAMDGEALVRSARVLFFHLTESGNAGEQFSDDRQQIVLKWGGRPSLLRAGRAEVELAFEDGRFRTVWALAEDGTPLREVPSRCDGAKLRFVADVAADPSCAAYQYEIKVTRPPGMRVIMR